MRWVLTFGYLTIARVQICGAQSPGRRFADRRYTNAIAGLLRTSLQAGQGVRKGSVAGPAGWCGVCAPTVCVGSLWRGWLDGVVSARRGSVAGVCGGGGGGVGGLGGGGRWGVWGVGAAVW